MPSARRPWSKAWVAAGPDGFGVRLDARPLLLPDGSTLLCPSRRLAEAVAEEWNQAGGSPGVVQQAPGAVQQAPGTVQETLPLTTLFGTMRHDLGTGTGRAIQSLLRFAATDLLCYRVLHPQALAALQQERWQPWLDWMEDRHGVRLLTTEGVMPIIQPETALPALRALMEGLSPILLTGLRLSVPALGSLVLGLALAERRLEADDAFALSRLDETFQSSRWGIDAEAAAAARRLRRDVTLAARWMELADE